MADSITLESPAIMLPGVSPKRAQLLLRLGLVSIADLLAHQPRRYEDRRELTKIHDISHDRPVTTSGTVTEISTKKYRGGARSVVVVVVEDCSSRLHCRWWNLPFMKNQFHVGQKLLIHGRPCAQKPLTMDHPEVETIEDGEENSIHQCRIVPVYPLTEGLSQRVLRGLIWNALEGVSEQIKPSYPNLPNLGLPLRHAAIRALHFPNTLEEAEAGRQRLAFDEIFELQITLQTRRRNLAQRAKSIPCLGDNHLVKPFLGGLPYNLTPAQSRVLRELRSDLRAHVPMRRLLQGDVGSGKTVVAAVAALMVLESNRSVLLMAPTEILAAQHHRTFQQWFSKLGISVHLHTRSHKTLDQLEALPTGACLVVGTHALVTDAFVLPDVGLVVIDEQHKFGVTQREQLVRKGIYPHLLIMTATPIPRTLGLTLYGDLDISILDEIPPGRKPIKTFLRTSEKLEKVWEFILGKLHEGRQVFVVCPRVDDSSDGTLKAVTKEWKNHQKRVKPFVVGLLHGRLKSEEKDLVMQGFHEGRIHLLLSTPLVEVGLDVPNATVMLIENAEQFGLAQLHQLRGRIGRGEHESYCILITETDQLESLERLRTLVNTTDGFKIAEADLMMRGPGQFLGQQQSGAPTFRFADLQRDYRLIQQARSLAITMLQGTP
ncbi:MAG: ATP-dependent DNA helicase RecG [Pedosphaera sp.]|nr:ATP-dependent DNA helicase RecG [Pedosphaera sp.]